METLFLGKFGPKHQHCQFQLKFSTKPNWNIRNPRVAFTFSVLHRKHSFWANFVQKRIIDSLSRNLVSRLTRILKIQWHCSLSLFSMGNRMFCKFELKKSTLSVLLKLGTKFNLDIPNSIVAFTFFASDEKHPFPAYLVQKLTIVIFSWNLAARIIRISKIQWWCSFFQFKLGTNLFGQIWFKRSKQLV